MKRLCAASIAALSPALSTGCATDLSHQRVAGWPQLEVVEHFVPHSQMRERCARYVGFGSLPIACAEFRLAERRCDIWYSADFRPAQYVIDHERKHCAGYDHVGSNNMRQILERYVAAGSPLAPELSSAAAGSSRP